MSGCSGPVPTADVVISIAYRDDLYDIDGIVNEIRRAHGLAGLGDVDPDTCRAIVDAHRR